MVFTATNTLMARGSMSADNTAAGLSVFAACAPDVRQLYLQNCLQLKPDKSDTLIVGTANQLCVAELSSSPVSVASVDLPVAEDMKVLGVVLDRRLTFHKHVSMIARSCSYHAQAIRHIRHLITTELAQTLACSLILSTIDCCNAVLHDAPTAPSRKYMYVEFRTMQLRLYSRRRGDPTPSRYCTICIG